MTLLRKLHAYAALASFVNLMVFGVVGLWAAFEARHSSTPPALTRHLRCTCSRRPTGGIALTRAAARFGTLGTFRAYGIVQIREVGLQ